MLTAGPGVTNGISGLTSAFFNASPVLVLGGRAPRSAGASGSLQEIDHVPLVAPVTKYAATVASTDDDPGRRRRGADRRAHPAPRPGLPRPAAGGRSSPPPRRRARRPPPTCRSLEPDPDEVARRAGAARRAPTRPVIIAGSDVYGGDAVAALRAAAEALQVPVFTNGMGRGALPPEHPLAFAKARRAALDGADVVAVVGTPLDFRLGFGDFGDAPGGAHRRRAHASAPRTSPPAVVARR